MKDYSNDELDAAIDATKNELPSTDDLSAASDRARTAIATNRGPQNLVAAQPQTVAQESAATSTVTKDSWDSLDDYIAAIPAYLAKQLTSAQTLLFEEESRRSIVLRRALNEARGDGASQVDELESSKLGIKSNFRKYAAAASVAAIALALIFALPELPSFNQSEIAQVESIDGQLYQIVDGGLEALEPGTWINGRQRIRSAGNSSAIITLDDGSQIEVDERSELSMTRRGSGNRVDVSRGRILVAASPQGSGTLDVFTNEFMVSVTGTIFEVAHGAKGSRVAVIEGSVNVLLEGDTTSLEPGEMLDSRMEYLALNIADEIAWSQNADQYLALLEEVAALQQDLEAIMDIPQRYSTRLLDLAPEDTAIYIAVPNAPEKIVDVYDVIRARMQSSETLGEMWAEFEAESEVAHLNEIMSWLREIGNSLGDETVVAITMPAEVASENGSVGAPVIMSEVDAAAFRASFDDQMEQLRDTLAAEGIDNDLEVFIVDDPADARDGELSILLWEDVLVASIDAETLQHMQNNLENGSSAFVDSDLHGLLQYSYDQGTEILGAVHFPRLFAPLEVEAEVDDGLEALGLDNAEYLIAQHQQQDGETTITADLFFAGERQGVMSWLANPGPMGSLEFFSTDTTFAAAVLLREPVSIIEEFGPLELPDDFDAQAELELFNNVMSVLGGEVAFGLDGPALPTPAWKVVIEAYDETLLQESIELSVAQFNEYIATEEELDASIEVSAVSIGGYNGYEIDLSVDAMANSDIEFSGASFVYVYADGYLVAGPDAGIVDRAISFYESGSGLQTDSEFRDLLSRDGYLDFSLVVFSRLGELLNDVLGNLPASLNAEQQAAISALDTEVGPSISSVLALPDRMHFAHNGSSQLPVQMLSQLVALQPLIESTADQITTEQ
jgi:hypothetical protein